MSNTSDHSSPPSATPTDLNIPQTAGALDTSAEVSAPSSVETPPDKLAALTQELQALQIKVAEHYEALLRSKAELENVRRRAAEDVSKAHKFGIESFAEALIPVKDSLELALADQTSSPAILREGVAATLKQLTAAFEKNHLREIAPAAGDKFDPHLHQGISMVASELPAQTVVSTLQKGAMIADRVLRPALVSVSSGSKL